MGWASCTARLAPWFPQGHRIEGQRPGWREPVTQGGNSLPGLERAGGLLLAWPPASAALAAPLGPESQGAEAAASIWLPAALLVALSCWNCDLPWAHGAPRLGPASDWVSGMQAGWLLATYRPGSHLPGGLGSWEQVTMETRGRRV